MVQRKAKRRKEEENIGTHLRSVPNHGGSGVAQLVAAGSFIVMDQEKVVLSNTGEGAIYLGGCVGQLHKRLAWGRSMVRVTRHMATKQQYKHAGQYCENHIYSTCGRTQKDDV